MTVFVVREGEGSVEKSGRGGGRGKKSRGRGRVGQKRPPWSEDSEQEREEKRSPQDDRRKT